MLPVAESTSRAKASLAGCQALPNPVVKFFNTFGVESLLLDTQKVRPLQRPKFCVLRRSQEPVDELGALFGIELIDERLCLPGIGECAGDVQAGAPHEGRVITPVRRVFPELF